METVRAAVPEVEDWQEGDDDFAPGSRRKTLTKREVEERGLAVVEELLDRGNVVHIVPEGRPGYVVVPEWLFDDWLDELKEARVLFSEAVLAEVAAGKSRRYDAPEASWMAPEQADADGEGADPMSSRTAPATDAHTSGDLTGDAPRRQTMPAREFEARGLAAVDPMLRDGPVHLIDEAGPGYVIMSEELFEEWRTDRHQAYVARVKAALAEVEAGRVERHHSVDALMAAIDRADDADDA